LHRFNQQVQILANALRVRVVRTETCDEDIQSLSHQRLRLRQTVRGLQQQRQVVGASGSLAAVIPVLAAAAAAPPKIKNSRRLLVGSMICTF